MELCLYKVKRGNFGITVQKYPHTQQHIIHTHPILSQIQEAEGERNDKLT